MLSNSSMRTPLARVRGLGSAKSGTGHFWLQRVTAVSNLILTIIFVGIVIALVGRPYPAVVLRMPSKSNESRSITLRILPRGTVGSFVSVNNMLNPSNASMHSSELAAGKPLPNRSLSMTLRSWAATTML